MLRRFLAVPGFYLMGIALLVLMPIWLPVVLLIDLFAAPRRLPRVRLMLFALWWVWLEIIGLTRAGWWFLTGRAKRTDLHFALQRWWANGLVVGLRRTCRLTLEPRHLEVLTPGPVIVLPRHASLADALLSAWFVTRPKLLPHYVLKRELLVDPCLDIVGNRLPNHFLDRGAVDSGPELAAIREMAEGVTESDECAVIFPEGTRANPEKRARGLARLAERNPERAAKLSALRHLNPPRPAGTLAVLNGAPDADIVIMAHAGFEGLDTFGGILKVIPGTAPILLDCMRIPRSEVPEGDDARTVWLDDQWLELDERVDALLAERNALVEAAGKHSQETVAP
ncbi:MAG: 1-acyl-sn-glycerol-3-phosphate acyltransferase [Acidimicrobiia bacterium]